MLSKDSVPIFGLYGESSVWPNPEGFHCESIAARSRLYNWVIEPHRHSSLLQFLYLQRGRVECRMEGETQTLMPGRILIVPPMVVHGFGMSQDVVGHVLTLAYPAVKSLIKHNQILSSIVERWQMVPVKLVHDQVKLAAVFSTLEKEFEAHNIGRETMMEAYINILLIWIARHLTAIVGVVRHPEDRSHRLFRRFTELIEKHYTERTKVSFYAAQIGVTAKHLNKTCRRLTAKSSQQIVHERLLLEAKRSLTFTTMSVAEVGYSLGFSDPAYFTRFFKRLTGVGPTAFRIRDNGTF